MNWVISHIKQIIGAALFILLLVAIPATMYLVRQQQVVRSRAAGGEDLTLNLYNQSGAQSLDLINGNLTTLERNIKVQVTYNPATTPSPTPLPTPTSDGCIPSGGSCNIDSQPCCLGYCDAEGSVDGTCRRN